MIEKIIKDIDMIIQNKKSKVVILCEDHCESNILGTKDGYLNFAKEILNVVLKYENKEVLEYNEENKYYCIQELQKVMHDLPFDGSVGICAELVFDNWEDYLKYMNKCFNYNRHVSEPFYKLETDPDIDE